MFTSSICGYFVDFLWETMSPTPSSHPAAGGQHFGLAAARSKEVAWQVERRWFLLWWTRHDLKMGTLKLEIIWNYAFCCFKLLQGLLNNHLPSSFLGAGSCCLFNYSSVIPCIKALSWLKNAEVSEYRHQGVLRWLEQTFATIFFFKLCF